jgi:hypothetical protein
LTELNTEKHTAGEINQSLDLHTGNFSTTMFNSETISGGVAQYFFLRGKVLTPNISYLLDIWKEVLFTLKLDNKDKIKQILVDTKVSIETSLLSNGRGYGLAAIGSSFTYSGQFDEITGGYRYLEWLRNIIAQFDGSWESVLQDLKHIQNALFTKENLLINITTSKENYLPCKDKISKFIDTFSYANSESDRMNFSYYSDKTVFIIPTKVNAVCYGVKLSSPTNELSGSLNTVINHLNFDYLWSKVRAQGGAYGAFASLNKVTGVFTISSYRDPRFEGTIQDFQGVSNYLQMINLNKQELLTSTIGAIGAFDQYVSARQKGWEGLVRILTGRTYDQLATIRQQILETSNQDFHTLGDLLEKSFESGKWAVFTSDSEFEKVKDKGEYDTIKPL